MFAFETELLLTVIITTFEYTKELVWYNLWLESDSTHNVVDLSKTKTGDVPWRFKARWSTALTYLIFINFMTSHIL